MQSNAQQTTITAHPFSTNGVLHVKINVLMKSPCVRATFSIPWRARPLCDWAHLLLKQGDNIVFRDGVVSMGWSDDGVTLSKYDSELFGSTLEFSVTVDRDLVSAALKDAILELITMDFIKMRSDSK